MIRLIPVDPEQHAELLFKWRQQPDVAQFMYSQRSISWADHLNWLSRLAGDPSRRYWIIEHLGKPIGSANLNNIDAENLRATFGMYVAEAGARMLGTGAAAEFLALEEAFGPLGLEKVSCEVFAVNEAPIRMHLRMGFKQEGIMRRHARFGGAWVDVHLFSILREEWQEKQPVLRKSLRKLLNNAT
jgi:UDP-4-amino-4,6-dideoxy-N-acetyl-beta-L-altrosamine N-acetyltransferase